MSRARPSLLACPQRCPSGVLSPTARLRVGPAFRHRRRLDARRRSGRSRRVQIRCFWLVTRPIRGGLFWRSSAAGKRPLASFGPIGCFYSDFGRRDCEACRAGIRSRCIVRLPSLPTPHTSGNEAGSRPSPCPRSPVREVSDAGRGRRGFASPSSVPLARIGRGRRFDDRHDPVPDGFRQGRPCGHSHRRVGVGGCVFCAARHARRCALRCVGS